jgi:two-component system NtrC family sensor kinase
MKILVVEDDAVTGLLLKKVLTKQGYEVTHVTDGAKGLEALQTESYRIILTDWMMPEMDGLTLCRRIRELNLPLYVYVILLTAKSSKDDAVTGLESGADDYIVKPFDNLELLARIRAGRRLVELEDVNRQTQLKLSHSEKLAAVGHLAAGVAHEINNPIGFINSNLNSLKSYMHDVKTMLACYRELVKILDLSLSQNKSHADLLGMIKKSTEMETRYDIDFVIQDSDDLIDDCSLGATRIKAIVHEMRYFAHPEKQSFESCSLAAILKKSVARLISLVTAGVTIENVTDHLPQIVCNETHIEQAFTNIIQNAVEAVAGDGAITINGLWRSHDIEIKIADTGRGITAEHLPMVFNPFFTTKEVGKGLGLGLTTAMNIIKMHNGTINCESIPGKGSCFSISLPCDSKTI